LRSGCFCAGPFGTELLKINSKIIEEIEAEVRMGIIYRKPGYLRLDLTFYLESYEIDYLADACKAICKHWKKIEKLYTVCSNGEVLRHEFIKVKPVPNYSLDYLEKVEKFMYENEGIENREKTLKKQLATGCELI
jgi:hypothetical protein